MRECAGLMFVALVALAGCATPGAQLPDALPRVAPLAGLQAVAVPECESERGIQWTATPQEYAAARADQRFVMEQFTFPSDGLTVGAYLYRPRQAPRRRLPVIVFNRGSFTHPNGFVGEMLVMANRYSQAGFIVVAPHYRGSNGWAGRDELGGADLDDLMNIAPQLARIEGADASHAFLSGESRGGAMVYQALREGFPARAAAWSAFTDVDPLIAPGGPQAEYAPLIWPDLDQNGAAIIERRSAIRWADRLNTPVLIMHGGADEDIPLEQSKRMDAELTRLGKIHALIVFEGQRHKIGGRGGERDAAALAWFRRSGASEVTRILEGNQVNIEHRFFLPSRPEPADWSDLTIFQQASDDHRLERALRSIYHGPWLRTGASKGGMQATYHKKFYPGDVDGLIAFVVPNDVIDWHDRYASFLDHVGTDPQCRANPALATPGRPGASLQVGTRRGARTRRNRWRGARRQCADAPAGVPAERPLPGVAHSRGHGGIRERLGQR